MYALLLAAAVTLAPGTDYTLVAESANGHTYVLDYGLTAEDCARSLVEWRSPTFTLSCQPEGWAPGAWMGSGR